MVVRPPRPCFHSEEVLPEFVVWSESPAGTWLQLPRSFTGELSAGVLDGLWLQANGCCSKASWVAVEVSVAGNVALVHGWQTFSPARGLSRRCTLHFKYDGAATLFVRVFGEDGRRAGCCPEDSDGDEVLGLGDGRGEDEGELALGDGHGSSSSGGSSSGESSSSGGYDQPPRRRACFKDGGGSSRRHAPLKLEEGSG